MGTRTIGTLDRPSDVVVASADIGWRRRMAQGLRREPGLGAVYEAAGARELERVLGGLGAAVVLLDERLPGLGDLRAVRLVAPAARVLVLAEVEDDARAVQAIKDGASGYCPREADPGLVRKAIQLVRQGEIWVGRRLLLRLIEDLTAVHAARVRRDQERVELLTERERQIVDLIAAGASNKEIAVKLEIAEKTVKVHLTHIFQKLGVSNRLQLAVYTLQPLPAA